MTLSKIVSAPGATLERLTWAEMCQRYPDEWMVLVDMDEDEDAELGFMTAAVFAHFKGSRKQCSPYVKAAFQYYPGVGTFFTGQLMPMHCIPFLELYGK